MRSLEGNCRLNGQRSTVNGQRSTVIVIGRTGDAIEVDEAFALVRYRLHGHSGMVIATRDALPGTEDLHHDIR